MYAIVYLDAIQFKVKDNGHFKNKAAYLAIGVNMDGLKEVRWWIAQTEGVKFWLQVGDGAQESGRNRAEFSLKWNA